jgi:integrase
MALTTRGLASIKPGEWLSDGGRKGAGRLAAFGMKAGGVAFYFRYTLPGGRRDTYPLGHFDAKGRDGLTLQQASNRAAELSKRYQAGERDLRAVLDAEEREEQRQRKAELEVSEADAAKQRATLGALLTGYVKQLERDGKASAKAVGRAIRLHVEKSWPKLWATPADDVTADDVLAVVAKVADHDKLREAAKLRAYLRAAYAAGVRARRDARALPVLRDLRITTNPARDLAPIDGGAHRRERALSVAELRAYWKRIESIPGPTGALLQFHLLTGGQRIEQLSRLTVADFDADRNAIRLRDGKGRRKVPRLHAVPLVPAAIEALHAMAPHRAGDFLFTVTAGESGVAYSTLLLRLRAVVAAMIKAGELEGGPFTAGDLRRTVETRLAALGVSLEVRAQLQSHGLGGVQARHYDRHDYMAEKRAALEQLCNLATGKPATVTPIERARQAR